MVFTQLQVVGWGWDIAAFLWLAGMSGMAAAIYAALLYAAKKFGMGFVEGGGNE
jgi:formate-dependent nitrite reductase membrane component NrfD